MQTINLFPVLAEEHAKLRGICDQTGWDRHHASYTGKRRLPWHLSFHDHAESTSKVLASARSESSLAGSLLYAGSTSVGGGAGCPSLSTTSKKAMESLSSSVYDELQPFRRAHRTLIKNRMASRSANDLYRTPSSSSSSSRFCKSVAPGSSSNSSSKSNIGEMTRKRKKQSPLASGLSKISLCASSPARMHGNICIRGFQRLRMRPAEFREQLQMSLHIYLRPSEGAAVAGFFDVEKVGCVDGESFVRWFLQTGLDSREQRLRAQAAASLEEQRLRRERELEEDTRQREADTAAVEVDFSQEDRAAAVLLLGKVALSYHDQRTGREAAQRDFACALGPVAFRLQLFRSFGISLTDRQFAALFDVMDINRDRCIDGAEFLHFFFGLGNRERAKEQRKHEINCRARARNLRLDKLPPITPILGR